MYKPLGSLGKIVKFIEKLLVKKHNEFNGNKEELIFIIKKIYDAVSIKFPGTKYELVDEIVHKFFDCKYSFLFLQRSLN